MDLNHINDFIKKVEDSQYHTFTTDSKRFKTGVDLGTAYVVLTVFDENDNPIACEKQFSNVVKDGVVVDYIGATNIVKKLKEKIETRLSCILDKCCIAMPSNTDNSLKTHVYVVEGAGFEVTNVVDEPSAANAIYKIDNGVIVDIGGGTTGIAIVKDSKVVHVYDEPTGGTHITLVLAGNSKISFDDAEKLKYDYKNHANILLAVKPTIEKMADIVLRNSKGYDIDYIYLCGGTCCLTGIENIFYNYTKIKTIKPENPFFVTPAGIAMNCIL